MIKIFKSFLGIIKKYGGLIFAWCVRVIDYIKSFVKEYIKSFKAKKNQADLSDNITEPTTVFERVVARQKSKQKVFKYRYAIIIGIAAVLFSLLAVLGNYVTVYNKNLPTTLCDEIIKGYEENEVEVFLENCTNLTKVLKNEENLKEYFSLHLPKGNFTYYRAAADKKDEQKYIFKSDHVRIAEIVFKKQKTTARYGIDKYTVKSFDIKPLVQYRFTAYSTFTLLINGIPADDYLYHKYTELENFGSVLETAITKNMYVTNDVNYLKEVKALDTDGRVLDIVTDYTESVYNVTIECDDKKEELTEYFNNFVLEYMRYTTKSSKESETILAFFDERSHLYEGLENYRVRTTKKYENERVENLLLDNLKYYGSGYYTCDVSADYLTDEKEETVTESFKKTIYLLFSDGKYYIVDMVDREDKSFEIDDIESFDTEEFQNEILDVEDYALSNGEELTMISDEKLEEYANAYTSEDTNEEISEDTGEDTGEAQ